MKKCWKLTALLLSLALLCGCSQGKTPSTAGTLPTLEPVIRTTAAATTAEQPSETTSPTTSSEEATTSEPETTTEESSSPEETTTETTEAPTTTEIVDSAEPILRTPAWCNGYRICIDAGHQQEADYGMEAAAPGSSKEKWRVAPGTNGITTGTPEYAVNLEVALKLRDELLERGYEVLMLRETNDVHISNVERATLANEAAVDAFLRLHCDGSENRSWNGILTMCQDEWNPYNKELWSESYSLSQKLLAAMCAATGAKNNGVDQRSDMSGINWAKVPVSLIEMGYLTNAAEEARLLDPSYQQKLAEGIADGLDLYLKPERKPEATLPAEENPETETSETSPAPETTAAAETTTAAPEPTTEKPVSTTQAPTTQAPTTQAAEEKPYDKLMFVGDSRTLSLSSGGRLAYKLVPETAVAATWGGCLDEESAMTNALTAAAARPEKVFFWYGVNDVQVNPNRDDAGIFIQNYTKILNAFQAESPNSRIYLISLITSSVTDSDYYEGQEENIRKYNEALKTLCQKKGFTFVDISSLYTGEDCFEDHIHFTKAWYENRFLPLIRSLIQ